MSDIIIYQSKNNEVEVQVQFDKETAWLSQAQIRELFERDQSVISRHINNVFKEGELLRKSNMQKMHIPNSDKPVAKNSLTTALDSKSNGQLIGKL